MMQDNITTSEEPTEQEVIRTVCQIKLIKKHQIQDSNAEIICKKLKDLIDNDATNHEYIQILRNIKCKLLQES